MKRNLVLCACLALAVTACSATKDTTADQAKLKTDSGIWFDKYNAGDADGVANLYADDAVVMPDKSPALTGKAAFRTWVAADIAKSKAAGLRFTNGSVTGTGMSGDVAWLSGSFTVNDPTGAVVDSGKYLSVYHRSEKDNSWLLVRDTWNSDVTPAPPPPAHAAPPKHTGVVGKIKGVIGK